jgi:hypothetical protein
MTTLPQSNSGVSYNYSALYQQSLLTSAQLQQQLGTLSSQQLFPGLQNVANAATIFVNVIRPSANTIATLKIYTFPVFENEPDKGFKSIYIAPLKPILLNHISYFDTETGEYDEDYKLSFNVSTVNFNGALLKGCADPVDMKDAANKQFVIENIGDLWWTKPALGNGCSTGKWFYRMTEDITTIEIDGIANFGEFVLILKGNGERDLTIDFLGADKHCIFASWNGPLRIGKHSFASFNILRYHSHYLVQMVGYN